MQRWDKSFSMVRRALRAHEDKGETDEDGVCCSSLDIEIIDGPVGSAIPYGSGIEPADSSQPMHAGPSLR